MNSSRANVAVRTAAMAGMAAMGYMVLLFARPANGFPKGDVSEVARHERIVCFPSVAAYDAKTNRWRVRVRAWLYQPERTSVKRRAFKEAMRKALGVPKDDASLRIFDERMSLFLVDNERARRVVVRIGSRTHVLGQTNAAGHVDALFSIPPTEMTAWRQSLKAGKHPSLRVVLPPNDRRQIRGTIFVVPQVGLSVISDIDDTIKITEVTNRRAMLANTLYRPFQPVAGMPRLYQQLEQAGAAFHYVSGSPWQLSEPLQTFLAREKFPAGSMHLRRFRLKDFRSLPELTRPENKPAAIAALLQAFPRRRFVLIGDSGERDPEVYGDVARAHTRQIAGVFIRNVTKESRSTPRMRTAFRGVPDKTWYVFDKPGEVAAPLAEIVNSTNPRR